MATTVANSPSPPLLSPSQQSPPRFPARKRRRSIGRSRSPVRTRSITNHRQRGPIKLSERTPPPCAPGAASNKQMQRKFMEMIGWVHEAITIDDLVDIIPNESANMIAIANEHSYFRSLDKNEIGDGYYTPQEVDRVMADLVEDQETSSPRSQSRACHCIAHENIESFTFRYREDFCDLIRTPQIMTNDHGKRFVIGLINIILFYMNITEYAIKPTEQGTPYRVNYILIDTETAEEQNFRGWPDFCVTQKSTGAVLVSVGEVESNENCLSQLGIYAAGQFQNITRDKLACVAIFRTKEAVVAVCSIDDDNIIQFKMVNSADRIDLKSSEGIQEFSKVFIATLKYISS